MTKQTTFRSKFHPAARAGNRGQMQTMTQNRINTILRKHELFLMGKKGGKRADFSGLDLFGLDLSMADLFGVNFEGAKLDGVNLSFANLRYANLCGAGLYGADLRGTDLSHAKMYQRTMDEASITLEQRKSILVIKED